MIHAGQVVLNILFLGPAPLIPYAVVVEVRPDAEAATVFANTVHPLRIQVHAALERSGIGTWVECGDNGFPIGTFPDSDLKRNADSGTPS